MTPADLAIAREIVLGGAGALVLSLVFVVLLTRGVIVPTSVVREITKSVSNEIITGLLPEVRRIIHEEVDPLRDAVEDLRQQSTPPRRGLLG